jgi:hypothetical protein
MQPVTTLDEAIFLIYPWPEGSILAKLVWEDRNRQVPPTEVGGLYKDVLGK